MFPESAATTWKGLKFRQFPAPPGRLASRPPAAIPDGYPPRGRWPAVAVMRTPPKLRLETSKALIGRVEIAADEILDGHAPPVDAEVPLAEDVGLQFKQVLERLAILLPV
jgi:hypothetical protein